MPGYAPPVPLQETSDVTLVAWQKTSGNQAPLDTTLEAASCACDCCSACGGSGCHWYNPCVNGGRGCTGNCHGWASCPGGRHEDCDC